MKRSSAARSGPSLQRALGSTYPTVARALETMERLSIVKELTGRRRNRLFAYAPYIALLSEGASR